MHTGGGKVKDSPLAAIGRRFFLNFVAQEHGALSKEHAAAYLSISVDTLERRVLGRVKTVRLGQRVLIPVSELDRFIAEEMESAL
jgi:excisionase family DNA binding protein